MLRRVEGSRRPLYVFGPFAVHGGIDLTLAVTIHPAVAAGALTVYGVGTSTGAVTFTSLLQAAASATHRGLLRLLLLPTWHYFFWNLMSQSPGVQHQGLRHEALWFVRR
ncbi:hypothetical protein ABZ078_22460 [Streptomyces sp. NPDC006385]|uniref:hypothetical protein n=1 Tax=Streptomyces sp. NPDC006385 TaxID=3156761 RepID=UPI0033BE2433